MAARSPKVSIATARVIPALLVLITAYGSYVIVGPLSINYLLQQPSYQAAGLAIPIIYFVLLLPVAASWFRLTWTVLADPGYLPQGSKRLRPAEDGSEHPPGLELFYERDAFVCDQTGLPVWCQYCHTWKPDRAHHNQDVGRCTRKMDHFCPWVGGVVGENSLKFFIQFLGYTTILTAYAMSVLAYFVARDKHDVQWMVALGLASFFLLFTLGMFLNSMHLVSQNSSTIEHLALSGDRKTYIAVVLPPELQTGGLPPPPVSEIQSHSSNHNDDEPLCSDLDDPSHVSYFQQRAQSPRRTSPSSSVRAHKAWKATITYPLQLSVDRPPLPAPTPRTFAVFELPQDLKPWKLRSIWANLAEVFGPTPDEWFLPFKRSPCCNHDSMISEFPLGPEFERFIQGAGLTRDEHSSRPETADVASSRSKRQKRKRRALDVGWQNGERPDSWVLEKEIRRQRKHNERLAREQNPSRDS